MLSAIICYSIIGFAIGVIFSLLFINFDKTWKKILSSLCCIGGSGGLILSFSKYFDIVDQDMKFWTTSFLYTFFMISFFLMMIIMCILIRDKDDKDILRIRDILLGQKAYIDKYYSQRAKEIDAKLNIPMLEAREQKVTQRENAVIINEKNIEKEYSKLDNLGKKKIRILLPENTKILVTDDFMEKLPSYIDDFSKCIYNIRTYMEIYSKEINRLQINIESFKSYLLSIATFISQYLFGGNSDIRVHFRYYNEKTGKYEKLVSAIGKSIDLNNMTSIPYENSMIKKSFECKRVLIKSINSEYDYESNNKTKWKDYMTFAFYNLIKNGKPYLTFGISVKNAARYKENFYFLNFVEFETYLIEYIEIIDSINSIEDILYKKGGKLYE